MITWLILAVLFNAYFVAMRICSPETMAGSFLGFSSVWFWLSVVCLLIFFIGKRFSWKEILKRIPRSVKTAFFSVWGGGNFDCRNKFVFYMQPEAGGWN